MSEKKTIPIVPADSASACAGAEPFALMVLGDYMEPEFSEGEIIVCEPEGYAKHGAFVVAEHLGDFYFRQLEIVDGEWFLKPLNPRYPAFQIAGPAAIKGVVVLKKKPGRRRAQKHYV